MGAAVLSIVNVLRLALVLLCLSTPATPSQLERRWRNHHFFRHVKITIPTIASKKRPVVDVHGSQIPEYDKIYYFDQLIDHSNPKLGTFKQRYFHTWEYYEQGGPIVLMTPGEQSMDDGEGHLTNSSMSGTIAQATKGAAIVLEHRFYGLSNPYPNLSVKSLQVHTIDQAMEDLVYFAQNVKLAMPGGSTEAIRPYKTPWILLGGSYAGALTAWTLNKKPDVFWAGYSSSGVVQPQFDFWQYFEPIRRNMPANCSADVEVVIDFIDRAIDSGNTTLINAIQSAFGLEGSSIVSFASALQTPISDWQTLDVTTSRNSGFYNFCDALEVQRGEVAPAGGWGLEIALESWASYYRTQFLPATCGETDVVSCMSFDTVQSYMNTTIDNEDRSWWWVVCNEVGWLQNGPPAGVPAIASRHLTSADYEKLCTTSFPNAFTTPMQSRVDATSKTYLGWNTTADRLFVVNGKRDPWLEVTLSATAAGIQSTDLRPIYLTDGFHCSDLAENAAVFDDSIAQVYREARRVFPQWVANFKPGQAPAGTTGSTTAANAAAHVEKSAAAVLLSLSLVLALL